VKNMRYPLLGGVLWLLSFAQCQACSDVMLDPASTRDGDVVSVRTLDFPKVELFGSQFVKVPRGTVWQSVNPNDGKAGLRWTSRYGFVGQDGLYPMAKMFHKGQRIYLDGMNETGLSAAWLWLDEAGYPTMVTAKDQALFIPDVPAWILSQYDSVAQVKAALANAQIWFFQLFEKALPLHLVVRDAAGSSIIVEWIRDAKGESVMHIYDGDYVDDVGVLTNSPPYPVQVNNLNLHSWVSNLDGLDGAPGGFPPLNRFVLLAKIRQFLKPIDSRMGAVAQALHLMNSADVPLGNYVDVGGYDVTGVTLVRDHTHRTLYFKGLFNQSLRKIDLKAIDFSPGPQADIPVDINPDDSERYAQAEDVTADLDAPIATYEYINSQESLLDLDLKVAVDPADLGKTGKMYIYAFDRDNGFWNWTGARFGWRKIPRGAMLPCYSGNLVTTTFAKIFVKASVTRWKGLRIFVGYGQSPADMLLAGTVRQVFMVEHDLRLQVQE
jgi:choloylglycine hydrolase